MAQALAEGIPGVEASRMEIDRGGPSYTVATVEALRAEAAAAGRPRRRSTWSSGPICVPDLGTWERADDLRRMVTLAVVSRPPHHRPGAEVPPRHARPAGGSSGWTARWSTCRARRCATCSSRGGPVDELVPAEVMHCIRRRNLYAVDR